MLTQERLKELLSYDHRTGYFVWVEPRNGVTPGSRAGSMREDGYISISIFDVDYLAHRLAWLYRFGYFPPNDTHHVDNIKHHNWIDNLEELTRIEHSRFGGNTMTNTSGIRGVTRHTAANKWMAQIKTGGRNIYLGLHDEFTEAVCHRLAAEQAENWPGCDSSSPAYQYVVILLSRLVII